MFKMYIIYLAGSWQGLFSATSVKTFGALLSFGGNSTCRWYHQVKINYSVYGHGNEGKCHPVAH